jgi:hypothetical protein
MSEHSIYKSNRLSIFILQDGFSFFVTDALQNIIFFERQQLEQHTQSVSELLKQLKHHITASFIEINAIGKLEVIYGNPQFGLVPDAYFDEAHLPHYLKYSSKLIEGDDFSYDAVSSIEAKTVYIPYVNINNYLFESFGSFEFTHIISTLIEKTHHKSLTKKEYIRIHVINKILYVVAFKNQKLQLSNAFSFETPEDFAYYILFCCEELGVNREEVSLDFTGDFYKRDDNTALSILTNYIRNIKFSNQIISSEFSFKQGFHEHYNLL